MKNIHNVTAAFIIAAATLSAQPASAVDNPIASGNGWSVGHSATGNYLWHGGGKGGVQPTLKAAKKAAKRAAREAKKAARKKDKSSVMAGPDGRGDLHTPEW